MKILNELRFMNETLAYLIDQTALRLGKKKAILFVRKGRLESQITYSSIRQISNRVANALIEMGLKKGERVILFMPKSVEQVVFHLAIQKVNAISVILNPGLKKNEMEYFLRDTDAHMVILGRKEEALVRSIDEKRLVLSIDTESPFTEEKLFSEYSSEIFPGEARSDDPALLIYTSGTTGNPKGQFSLNRIWFKTLRTSFISGRLPKRMFFAMSFPSFMFMVFALLSIQR
jgi:acyl-coenzyme A synthetase/AMP-(fatty) acid ligase